MTSGRIYEAANESGVRILKITGDFTKETVPYLQNICHEASKCRGTKGILLDFKGILNIDTSAFACVINFIKTQIEHGVNVGVMNMKSQEKALAEILKISKAIRPFETESVAIAALSKKDKSLSGRKDKRKPC